MIFKFITCALLSVFIYSLTSAHRCCTKMAAVSKGYKINTSIQNKIVIP